MRLNSPSQTEVKMQRNNLQTPQGYHWTDNEITCLLGPQVPHALPMSRHIDRFRRILNEDDLWIGEVLLLCVVVFPLLEYADTSRRSSAYPGSDGKQVTPSPHRAP